MILEFEKLKNTASLEIEYKASLIVYFPLSSHTPVVRHLLWAHCSWRNSSGSWSSTCDALVPVPLVSQYLIAHWIFPMDRGCVWCKPTTVNQFKAIIWKLSDYRFLVIVFKRRMCIKNTQILLKINMQLQLDVSYEMLVE